MKTQMNKTYGTRLDPELANRLERALNATGMRSADLIRHGIRRVVGQIEKDGGLLIATRATPKPKAKTQRKGAKV